MLTAHLQAQRPVQSRHQILARSGFFCLLPHYLRTGFPVYLCQVVFLRVFENEFFLLRRNAAGALEPADNTVFCATGSMNLHRALIIDLADALIAQGLEAEGYYPESGPGQQEVNIRYAEAMRAADRQIVYRETVRGEAAQHGLIASFFAKDF